MSFHCHELPCGFIWLGSSSDLRDASSFTFLNPPLHSATLLLFHSPLNPLVFTAPILACRLVTTQHTSTHISPFKFLYFFFTSRTAPLKVSDLTVICFILFFITVVGKKNWKSVTTIVSRRPPMKHHKIPTFNSLCKHTHKCCKSIDYIQGSPIYSVQKRI